MRRWLPSLNGLKAFEAAARHGSFTRAAGELNVTQTAISHQIRRLEEQLGLKFFVRDGPRLRLTPAAQTYLPTVRDAFDALGNATALLRQDHRADTVTVSTLISFAAKWLVPRLARFQAAHPDIDLRVTTSSALVDFERDDVDVAIRYGGGTWPGLRVDHLLEEDLFPVCSPDLLTAPVPLREPKDLVHHSLIHVTPYRDDWQIWLSAVGVDGVDTSQGLQFDLAFTAVQAAIDGAGVAIGRTALVEGDLEAGRLVTPFDIRLRRHAYYMVAPERTADRPPVAAFRDWLIAAVAENQEPVSTD